MLFTRCPECETTFRVTDDTLKKAHGQVRCGRCASVFNAYAELRDPNGKSFDRTEPPAVPAARPPAAQETSAAPPAAAAPSPPPAATEAPASPSAALEAAPSPARDAPAEQATPGVPDPIAAALGVDSLEEIVAQVEQAAEAESAFESASEVSPAAAESPALAGEDGEAQIEEPISAKEVDEVLTSPVIVRTPRDAWPPFAAPPASAPEPRRSWWAAASAVALVTLALQVLNHFRTELAGNSAIGSWLQGTYSVFGVEVEPRWDVNQYEIVEWVATAEPNARGLGSLKITAHIMNRGPMQQPYPAVKLELKDRWEDAVGRRLFAPSEYLPRDVPRARMMAAGETARAEIEVVDPGPDAYGFELDVCIEVEASAVSCRTDEVFLSTR